MWDKMKCYGDPQGNIFETFWELDTLKTTKIQKLQLPLPLPKKKIGPIVNLAHLIRWYGILYHTFVFYHFWPRLIAKVKLWEHSGLKETLNILH
jgi:hypothetical protein